MRLGSSFFLLPHHFKEASRRRTYSQWSQIIFIDLSTWWPTMEVFSMKQTILSILVCLQGSDRRSSTDCCRVIPWRLCHFQKSSRSLSHPRDHCIPLRTTLSLLQPSIVFDKGFLLYFWVWVLDEKGSGFAGARFYCSSYCCACLTILIIWALVLHFAS